MGGEGRIVVDGYDALLEAEFLKFAPAFGDDEFLFGRGTAECVTPGPAQVGGVALGVGYPVEDFGGEDGGAEGGEGGGAGGKEGGGEVDFGLMGVSWDC